MKISYISAEYEDAGKYNILHPEGRRQDKCDRFLLFDNGTYLYVFHNRSYWEEHYADFETLSRYNVNPKTGENISIYELEFKEDIENYIERVPGMGFNLIASDGGKYFVPCYGYNNGYYSDNLSLFVVSKTSAGWAVDQENANIEHEIFLKDCSQKIEDISENDLPYMTVKTGGFPGGSDSIKFEGDHSYFISISSFTWTEESGLCEADFKEAFESGMELDVTTDISKVIERVPGKGFNIVDKDGIRHFVPCYNLDTEPKVPSDGVRLQIVQSQVKKVNLVKKIDLRDCQKNTY